MSLFHKDFPDKTDDKVFYLIIFCLCWAVIASHFKDEEVFRRRFEKLHQAAHQYDYLKGMK
jgi:hypothetical protein